MSDKNQVYIGNGRDFYAFCEVIMRSDLGYKSYEVKRIEVIPEDSDLECNECDKNADLRVVRKAKGFYSDEYCWKCFRNGLREWFDDMMDKILKNIASYDKEGKATYRTVEEPDRLVIKEL